MPSYRDPSPPTAWPALLAAVALGAGLGLVASWGWAGLFARQPPALDPTAEERTPLPATPPDGEESEAAAVFQGAKDSVVNVDTVARVRRFDTTQEQQTGTGSGFVWDDAGRVVTNFHVVRQAIQNRLGLRVVMADRTAYDAKVIGAAPEYDLAVVQITAPKDKLKPIAVGTSKDLTVGRKAFAIGNPFGLSLTMTKGIISALDREIESPAGKPISGAIQTDAPINPGNSGGPLLDKTGRLIGVNTAISTPNGGNVGIGFAIPVDSVNPVVTEIIQRGRLLRPDVGLQLVSQQLVRRNGFPNGVMVGRVDAGGPAAAAGLKGVVIDPDTGDASAGDLITAVNGQPVRGNADFERAIAKAKPGETLTFTVERGEKTLDVPVAVRGV